MPLNLIDESIGNWIFLKYINFTFKFILIYPNVSAKQFVYQYCKTCLIEFSQFKTILRLEVQHIINPHYCLTLMQHEATNQYIKKKSWSTHKFLTKFIIQCHFSTSTLIVNNPFSLHNDTSYMVLSHSCQCKLHLQFVHLQSKCLMQFTLACVIPKKVHMKYLTSCQNGIYDSKS